MKDNKPKDTVTTSTGFKCVPNRDALDDIEVFDDLMIMDDPDATNHARVRATNRVFEVLMGDKQLKALKDHLIKLDGRVKITAYQREQNEIFAEAAKAKKK